jgi:hypothetical protein
LVKRWAIGPSPRVRVCVGLERGQGGAPGEHLILPGVRDELKYAQRLELSDGNG